MGQYFEFAANHWELFLALVVILALLFGGGLTRRLRGFQGVSPQEATQLMNHQNAVMLDVREDAEFRGGHVLNAIHIPLGYLDKRLKELEKHKSKPIIVGCRSGHRSARAAALLKKQGFETVYNLDGGIVAWENASLPLIKKK